MTSSSSSESREEAQVIRGDSNNFIVTFAELRVRYAIPSIVKMRAPKAHERVSNL